MTKVKWIKIVTDIFDDEKVLLIEAMPEADSLIVIWFKLLCLAGKINNGGVIMLNDKLPFTDEMVSTIFRRPIGTIRLALKTFENLEMIKIINNAITIPNWSKHQSLDQLERRKEGFSLNNFKNVIENKVSACKDEAKMNSFLTSSTLFGKNFESYLNKKILINIKLIIFCKPCILSSLIKSRQSFYPLHYFKVIAI